MIGAGLSAAIWFGGWLLFEVYRVYLMLPPVTYQNLLGLWIGLIIVIIGVVAYARGKKTSVVSEIARPPTDPEQATIDQDAIMELINKRFDEIKEAIADRQIAFELAPSRKEAPIKINEGVQDVRK